METFAAQIPVVIPAYEPDERLVELIKRMVKQTSQPIVVVDDGSGKGYEDIFHKVQEMIEENGGCLLIHDRNRGKGRALKTAFEYLIGQYPQAVGCVTADSDGQHTPDCISKVSQALAKSPQAFVLGVRNFHQEEIPWKSRFGNRITENVFAYVTGMHITDTQTGLRGSSMAFMRRRVEVRGGRFEFETRMLMVSKGKYPIIEVPIETIYDSVENHQTHFRPVVDSIKIYRILGGTFLKYIFASLSSFVVDIVLFSFFSSFLEGRILFSIAVSTALARMISATYNYAVNYKVVFKSREKISSCGIQYLILAVIQMGMSAALVTGGVWLFIFPKEMIKVLVDTILFLASYYIQHKYIFQKN